MAISPKYFKYPFAQNGDKATVPNEADQNNTVTWETGYTPSYSEKEGNYVERNKFNDIQFEISNTLQWTQEYNYNAYIKPEEYGTGATPVPYPYRAFTYCYTTDLSGNPVELYQSLVANNIVSPTDVGQKNWALIDYASDTALWYKSATINFEASVATGDLVAFSKTTAGQLQKAVENGDALSNVLGIADVEKNRVLVKGAWTGSVGGIAPGLLTAGATYYLSDNVLTSGTMQTTPSNAFSLNTLIGRANSVDTFYIDSQKVARQPATIAAKVHTDTTITLSVPIGQFISPFQKLPYNIVNFDPSNLFSVANNAIIVQEAGVYSVTASVSFYFVSGAEDDPQVDYVRYYVQPRINGVADYTSTSAYCDASEKVGGPGQLWFDVQPCGTSIHNLQIGDQLTIYVAASIGKATNVVMDFQAGDYIISPEKEIACYLDVHKIR